MDEAKLRELTTARLGEIGFFLDFDGTLALIGPDPEAAEPVPGSMAVLAALAGQAAQVAVVSARPVTFLGTKLGTVPGLYLYGLYGLESSHDGGRTVRTVPEAEPYAPLIARLVAEARAAFPDTLIEDKRLSCALHFRTLPHLAEAIDAWAVERAARDGLTLQRGRMVVELKPALNRNKGTVLHEACAQLAGAWYFGDDLGDLPAFDALDEIVRGRPDFLAVRAAVANPELPGADLARRADIRLEDPQAVADLLRDLVSTAPSDARHR
jgi:trehalose 6-phosphate phosphatase